MSRPANIATLNRLLHLQYRSLPMYAQYGSFWSGAVGSAAQAALNGVVRDQERLSARIAELIQERGGVPSPGEFPMEFADLNYLSLDYFLEYLVTQQQADMEDLEAIVAKLADDPEARALAEEALGAERAHAEVFEGLLSQADHGVASGN